MQTVLVKLVSQEAEQITKAFSEDISYFAKCYSEWKKLRSLGKSEKLGLFEKRHGVAFVQLLVLFDSLVGSE